MVEIYIVINLNPCMRDQKQVEKLYKPKWDQFKKLDNDNWLMIKLSISFNSTCYIIKIHSFKITVYM